jgi:ribosomal subunit interface protein
MQIAIQTNGFEITEGLRVHVERRIRFAFDWADLVVNKVAVRLSDLNGPRGGEDKRCVIQVAVSGAPDVVIEDTQSDLYVAIDRAADRAGRSLARKVERQRKRRNGGSRDARVGASLLIPDVDDAVQAVSIH